MSYPRYTHQQHTFCVYYPFTHSSHRESICVKRLQLFSYRLHGRRKNAALFGRFNYMSRARQNSVFTLTHESPQGLYTLMRSHFHSKSNTFYEFIPEGRCKFLTWRLNHRYGREKTSIDRCLGYYLYTRKKKVKILP